MNYTVDELKTMSAKKVDITKVEGYINGGRELVRIKQDPFDKRRFVVWSETNQRQLAVRSNKTAAIAAFLGLF